MLYFLTFDDYEIHVESPAFFTQIRFLYTVPVAHLG